MFEKIKHIAKSLKTEIKYYKLVLEDRRTPLFSKILLYLAIAYFLSPIDVIPDFLPIIGQLDDIIIVPFLVLLAVKMIPKQVLEEHKTALKATES